MAWGVTVNLPVGDYKAGDGSSLGKRMEGTGTIRVLGQMGLVISVK